MRGAAKLIAVEDEDQEDTQDEDEDTNDEDTDTDTSAAEDEDTDDTTDEDSPPDLSKLYEDMPEDKQQKLADVVPLKAALKNRQDREICETLCKTLSVDDLMKLASGLVQYVMGGKDTPRDRLQAYADELWEICKAVDLPEKRNAA